MKGLKKALIAISVGCVLFLTLVTVAIMTLGTMATKSPEDIARAEAKEAKAAAAHCTNEAEAFRIAQQFIRPRLKAPSTAKFSPRSVPGDTHVGVNYLGNCKHDVGGFVDSENSFGAHIRTYYWVQVQNQQNTDKWVALNVEVGERGK